MACMAGWPLYTSKQRDARGIAFNKFHSGRKGEETRNEKELPNMRPERTGERQKRAEDREKDASVLILVRFLQLFLVLLLHLYELLAPLLERLAVTGRDGRTVLIVGRDRRGLRHGELVVGGGCGRRGHVSGCSGNGSSSSGGGRGGTAIGVGVVA